MLASAVSGLFWPNAARNASTGRLIRRLCGLSCDAIPQPLAAGRWPEKANPRLPKSSSATRAATRNARSCHAVALLCPQCWRRRRDSPSRSFLLSTQKASTTLRRSSRRSSSSLRQSALRPCAGPRKSHGCSKDQHREPPAQ
eukprot:6354464-Prymnesium_polylepis.1